MTDLTDFMVEKEDDFYHSRISRNRIYRKKLQQIDQNFIKEIESCMAHQFRYYQKEAMVIFDFLYKIPVSKSIFKEELYEKSFAKEEIPFYGFEMATGSGKTLLIGALIIYLFKTENYKNFLIITPSTEIYKKTINNLDVMSKKSIFSQSIEFKFNVVNGDNFINKSSNYDEDSDFNVFIFNIQKFFERTTGILKVDKEWEESYWKDKLGNTITFREFLKSNRLVIITDEAHHYQNIQIKGREQTSGKIIISLEPELVLEFTATAITEEEAKDRRTQKIIYKFPINKFISDGYGKRARAYGYSSVEEKSKGPEITKDDKNKFLVSYMIHLVKKIALKQENFKPILLIRARNIEHADNLYKWVKNELNGETKLIENIHKEIVEGEKFVITALIKKYISLDYFKESIAKLPKLSFVYHSQNENDKEIIDKVNTIETNDQEVLIQIKKLEEGWDIKNPYTILILSISKGDRKNYIKQLIGRGVRLFRESRIHDGVTGFLRNQQEILHIVCERGGNFEDFIKEIRKELGLTSSSFKPEIYVEQKTNKTIAEFEKYNDLELPIIEIYQKTSISPIELLNDITFKNLKLDLFVDNNTYTDKGEKYWKIIDIAGGSEEELTGRTVLKLEEAEYKNDKLKFKASEIKKMVSSIITSQKLLPSHVSIKSKLTNTLNEFNHKIIKYVIRNYDSRKLYIKKLQQLIVKHIVNVLDNYFNIKEKIKKKTLKKLFPEEPISIEKSSEKGVLLNVKKKDYVNANRTDFVHILITDFKKSYYKYNWFESSHEFKLAYQLDGLNDVEFWIRNKRNYYQEYGVGNKYYPDFIVKSGPDLYIIEVKGTYYLKNAKTQKEINILKKLRSKGYKTLFLTDNTIDTKIFKQARNFKSIFINDDLEHLSYT